jgi:hypothetical protein
MSVEAVNSLDDIVALQNELKKAIAEKGEGFLKKIFNDVFDKYPEVKALGWTQYTPYFNDGDTCTFSVHDIYGAPIDDVEKLSGLEYGFLEEVDDDGGQGDMTFSSYDHQGIKELEKALHSSAGEEVLKVIFGDHVKIIVTRAGIEAEEYTHD